MRNNSLLVCHTQSIVRRFFNVVSVWKTQRILYHIENVLLLQYDAAQEVASNKRKM